jgi:hypothetical protein
LAKIYKQDENSLNKELEALHKKAEEARTIGNKQKSVLPYTNSEAMKEGILYINKGESSILMKIGDKSYKVQLTAV